MTTLNDSIFDSLRALAHTGTVNDMLLQWLQSFGAVSDQINDAWIEMLVVQGIPLSQYNDMWFEALGLLGFEGSLNDRELAFWSGDPSEIPLPNNWWDETSLDTELPFVTEWLNVGGDTDFDFDDATGPVTLANLNGLPAASFLNGFLNRITPTITTQPFEGFVVVYLDDLITPQTILGPPAQAANEKVELTVLAGNLLLRTDPTGTDTWTTLSLPLTRTGIYVIHIKVNGATSILQFKDTDNQNFITSGALDTNDYSFARLGNTEGATRQFLGIVCEMRFYLADVLIPSTVIAILTSLYNKWQVLPVLHLDETTHDFSGGGGSFVGWDNKGSLNGSVTLRAGNVNDVTQGLLAGKPTIHGENVALFLANGPTYFLNTTFIVFKFDAPNVTTTSEFIADGLNAGNGRQVFSGNDEGYAAWGASSSGDPRVGTPDSDVHLLRLTKSVTTANTFSKLDGIFSMTRSGGHNRVQLIQLFADVQNNRRMTGDICEVIVYDQGLPENVVTAIENELMIKWGVTMGLGDFSNDFSDDFSGGI